MIALTACLFLCGGTSSMTGNDWPQFRGTGGAAISRETGLALHWGPSQNLRWKADLPGRGVSSPVVAKGKVYVTACSGAAEDRLHVLCYALETGKLLWQRQLWATGNTMCNPKTSMAGPTPVTDGDRVYALFATGDLVCFDSAGNMIWYRALAKDYPTIGNNVGMAASPILWKDVLLLPMENVGESFVAGIDKHSGKNIWKSARARDINWVTPFLLRQGDRAMVLFQSAKELTAYDPETGKQVWNYQGGLSNVPTPVMAGDLILVATGGLTALRLQPDNQPPKPAWQSIKLQTGYTSAVYSDGRVYGINGAGILNCASVQDGKVLWQERLKGKFSASPVIADGKLYAVNEDGTTLVVQLGNEPKVLATNALDEPMLASPAIVGRSILLRSERSLFCVGEKK